MLLDKYPELYTIIALFYEKVQDKTQVLNRLKDLELMYGSGIENYTDICEKLVDEYVSLIESNKKEIIKLSESKQIFEPNENKGSAWSTYKRTLLEGKKWTIQTVETIKQSSSEIISQLNLELSKHGVTKGLVLGNVQSGKTANMAGVISMAADLGFNYFIVLSGSIENLRKQTADRLYNDLKGDEGKGGNFNWELIDNPSVRSTDVRQDISKFHLGEGERDRYLTICLKNRTRLRNLREWLYSDKNKARQLKILIIDDEADQASINTNDISDLEPTAINGEIKEILKGNVKAMNYVAYTATPYANILNETGEDSLYPKDFIVVLPQSSDYIGPSEIFGTTEPEQLPRIDIVREISKEDADSIRNNENLCPSSLKTSINWFVICVCAMRALNYRNPISMLVHTSFRVDDHNIISDVIKRYLLDKKNGVEAYITELENLYRAETIDFDRQKFIENMPRYSDVDEIPYYPNWADVKNQIIRLFQFEDNKFISHVGLSDTGQPKFHDGIHIAIDNSRMNGRNDDEIIRLVYPKKNETKLAPAFIVIGGNTLSRGLTLEGLVSTYFLRTTNQADTLMQMGRWFGYRKGYELFPRIWLEELAYDRFIFLSQMNSELREELEQYSINGLTPKQYAPKIKSSPDYQLVRITSNNKMQSAISAEFNFSGFNSQTIYFKDNFEMLQQNFQNTESFLNSLSNPKLKYGKMVWTDVSNEKIESYLNQYKVIPEDTKLSLLPNLVEWLKDNNGIVSNWNVVLSSKGDIQTSNTESEWDIHGYNPKGVTRTKLVRASKGDIISIGALRSPSDLVADIDDFKDQGRTLKMYEVISERERAGLGDTPLLIVYRVDKNSEGHKLNEKNGREPLNFSQDIIGLSILIPGNRQTKNLETYISPVIDEVE